jgi:hypothetical protein
VLLLCLLPANRMREKEVRQERQCVFPEVPRTHTFGRFGSRFGQHYDSHLSKMIMNDAAMNWTEQDLGYLLKDRYAALMSQWLSAAHRFNNVNNVEGVPLQDYCNVTQPAAAAAAGDMVVEYYGTNGTALSYLNVSQLLVPMLGDLREGSPRASYNGVVVVRCRGRRLFLKPADYEFG